MFFKWIRCSLLALGLLAGGAAGAAQIREVAAADIQRAVGTEGLVLVLFSSPDNNCGYCIGQSQMFDEFAKTYRGPAKLLRVQWSPWRAFPPAALFPTQVYGLPLWVTFRAGKEVIRHDGKIADMAVLQSLAARAVDAPTAEQRKAQALAAQAAAPPVQTAAKAEPLSTTERNALAALAWGDLLQGTLQECAQRLPARKSADDARLAAWRAKNKAALDLAALLMLKRSSREDAAEMSAITQQQATRLHGVLAGTTELQASCDKVAAQLDQ